MDLSYIGKRIEQARKQKNLEIKEIANMSDLTDSYYRRIEKSNQVPSLETLVKIATILDTTAAKLLEPEQEPDTIKIQKDFYSQYLSVLTEEEYSVVVDSIRNISINLKRINLNKTEKDDYVLKFLGESLKIARSNSNLTQTQVSDAVNLSQGHYWYLENGEKLPRTKTFIKLTEVLNVSPYELLDNHFYGDTLKALFNLNELDGLLEIEYKTIFEIIKILSKYLVFIREYCTEKV